MRAFVAITPPQEVIDELLTVSARLRKQFPKVTWEEPEKFHMTLAFFASLDEDELQTLLESLTTISEQVQPFLLQLGTLEYFYKKHEDSILYSDIVDKERSLRNLYDLLKDELYGKLQDLPDRLTPHITVGRVKRMRHPHEVKKLLSTIRDTEIMLNKPFEVRAIDVYETLKDRSGQSSHYRLVRKFRLGG